MRLLRAKRAVATTRRAYVVVMALPLNPKTPYLYRGWSDHRRKPLPVGEWIPWVGEPAQAQAVTTGSRYPNGFHAIFGPSGNWGVAPVDITRMQTEAPLPLMELQVELRGVTHTGTVVLTESGVKYRACVAGEMRIPPVPRVPA